jgi:tetratricopeptide (TPR) repeat protein
MNLTMIRCRRLVTLAAVPAVVTALAVAAGCGQKSYVLLEQPLRDVVKTESNSQALMAWADAQARADILIHVDGSDDLAIFPAPLHETMKNTADHLERGNSAVVNKIATIIENGGTVNIGMEAGMYKRVIWVIPSPGSVTDHPLENFKQVLVLKRGYHPQELMDLTVSGKHIKGMIAGVPLTVTSLEDLDTAGETALLDIDLSYFTGLQAISTDYRPGTASLLDFLRVLKSKKIPAVMATINRDMAAPLDVRYYADVIEEVLADPSLLEEPVPEKYNVMIQAEKALSAGQYGEAESLYAGLVEAHPDDAALHFSHALALGFLDKGEECRDAMLMAFSIDASYMRGFFQLARVLGASGHINSGEALLKTSDLEKTLPKDEMKYQWGLFYMQAGLYQDAVEKLVDVAAKRRKDFAVKTVLYRAYAELGETRRMYSVLEDLVELDSERVGRDMPWAFRKLGDLAYDLHLDPVAADWYEQYLALVPDDPGAARMRELIEVWKDREVKPIFVE